MNILAEHLRPPLRDIKLIYVMHVVQPKITTDRVLEELETPAGLWHRGWYRSLKRRTKRLSHTLINFNFTAQSYVVLVEVRRVFHRAGEGSPKYAREGL